MDQEMEVDKLRERWLALVSAMPKKPRLREIEAMVRVVDKLIEERNTRHETE